MKDLTIFEAPNDGEITLCEVNGKIHSVNCEYANLPAFTSAVERHPKVHITRDLLCPHSAVNEARALFLTVDEPYLKRLIQIYYEHGFMDALQTAAESGPFVLKKSASLVVGLLRVINSIQKKISRNSYETVVMQIVSLSQTRYWLQSPIRCIAWHYYSTKVAVAAVDDTVRIYSGDSNLVPLLKCKGQKNITCMAWRPLSNSDIAVGCENGIFVWNVDPSSLVTRPSTNSATVLYRVNHKPVVSLAWSLRGDLLVSAAANDPSILVWNVELDETSSLKRSGASGNVLLRWSPAGDRLFSATTGVIFRVWDCQNWQAERWTLLSGRVQAACWSPCGTVLFFTTSDEPLMYALSFVQSEMVFAANASKCSPNQATPVYDLSKVDINGLIVGGIVQSMDWDSAGDNLAVLFQDTNYVTVFKVSLRPVLQLSPSSLIVGLPEEKPTLIQFQKNFDLGACLSIAWSSGRLQYYPIIYSKISAPSRESSFSAYGSHVSFH